MHTKGTYRLFKKNPVFKTKCLKKRENKRIYPSFTTFVFKILFLHLQKFLTYI